MTVVGYGSVVPAKPIVRNASTIVGVGMLGVQADGLVVVLDGPLVIAQVTVGVASVVEGVGILRVQADSLSKSWMALW